MFLVTSGDEWQLAGSFLGCRRVRAGQPTNQHTGLQPLYRRTCFTGSRVFPIFDTLMSVYFLSNHHLISPLWWTERYLSVFVGFTFAWQGAVDSWLRDEMFPFCWIVSMLSTPSCWSLFRLTIKPTQSRWVLTPTYFSHHWGPSLSYFLHPGQQHTSRFVFKLSADP